MYAITLGLSQFQYGTDEEHNIGGILHTLANIMGVIFTYPATKDCWFFDEKKIM